MASMSTPAGSHSSSCPHYQPSPSSTATYDDDHGSISNSSSSEDEDGVFFGEHDPREHQYLAKLSLSVVSSPSSTSSPSSSTASSTSRIRKRDSREFLRRKTLGSSFPSNASPLPNKGREDSVKKWSGGFYEQGARAPKVEVDSDEEWSTPVFRRSQYAVSPARRPLDGEEEHCDLTFDFSKFRVTDLPSPEPSSGTPLSFQLRSPISKYSVTAKPVDYLEDPQDTDEDLDDDVDSLDGGSDKENSGVYNADIQMEGSTEEYHRRDVLVTIGLDIPQEEDDGDDLSGELDMGGLRIDDLADPLDDVFSVIEESSEINLGDDSASEESASERSAIDENELNLRGEEMPAAEEETDLSASQTISPSAPVEDSSTVDAAEEPLALFTKTREQSNTRSFSPTPSADDLSRSDSLHDDTVLSETIGLSGTPDDHPETSTALLDVVKPDDNVTINHTTYHLPTELEGSGPGVDDNLPPSDPRDLLDSPIPLARAGPVIIPSVAPHLAFSIRAESGSPCRPFPPSQPTDMPLDTSSVEFEAGSNSLGNAELSTPPPQVTRPVPSTEGRVVPVTPSVLNVSTLVGPAAIKPKTLLSSINGTKSMTASVDRTKSLARSVSNDKKAAGRALVIRGQLESALGSRFGPPQRSALGSSAAGGNLASQGKLKLASSVSRTGPAKTISTQKVTSRLIKAEPPTLSIPTSSLTSISEKSTTVPPASRVPISLPRTLKQSASAPTRMPLVPRKAPPAVPNRTSSLTSKPLPRPVVPMTAPLSRIAVSSTVLRQPMLAPAPNPLKRPLSTSPTSVPSSSRASVAIVPTGRIGLGQPSRIVSLKGESVLLPAPVFSVGLPGPELSSVFKSPARTRIFGTPRKLGTPARNATPSRGGLLAKFGTPGRHGKPATPSKGVAPPTPTRSSSLPTRLPIISLSSATKADTDRPEKSDSAMTFEADATKERGSSEDHEDVSMIIPEAILTQDSSSTSDASPPPLEGKVLRNRTTPPRSPIADKDDAVRAERPKRSIKPPQQLGKPKPTRTASAPALSSVPGMSEKELKLATQRNTSKNEVYHCAIDRQVVRITAPRPPSPTSKIRTTADRDEEEKKAGRERRAKRRSRGSDVGSIELYPVIERVERIRGPGDEEDYKTPMRPIKKAKIRHEKNVKWDKGLIVIRDDGSQPPQPRDSTLQARKSCLRGEAQVELDRYGNMIEAGRPKEALKRQKILVTAVFYEGEEPVPTPTSETAPSTTSSKGKKKQ